MFISNAYAADAAPAAGGDMSMIIVLTICMVAVYFFVMRPNSKKRKEMQKLLDNLAVGDEVLTMAVLPVALAVCRRIRNMCSSPSPLASRCR